MNTHSLTKNNGLLKFLEFLITHVFGISTPLQDDSSKLGKFIFHSVQAKATEHRANLLPGTALLPLIPADSSANLNLENRINATFGGVA